MSRDEIRTVKNSNSSATDTNWTAVTGTDVADGADTKRALDVNVLATVAPGGSSNTTTAISNITIALASTEQSVALPASCKGFLIRIRDKAALQLAYTSGASGTSFLTIPAGSSYKDENFYSAQTLYFQSAKAGAIVELVTHV